MRQRDEDQRENRGYRTRTPIRDRGRRVVERSPERKGPTMTRITKVRKQLSQKEKTKIRKS